jgi:hypothetical protein
MGLKLPVQIWRYSLQNFHVEVEFSSEFAKTAGGIDFGSRKERFHVLKTQAWVDDPCWGQKPTSWIIKWKLFVSSGTEKSISYLTLCFPDYWTIVLLCWMYLNRMYVGRCAEGCFMGAELGEFSVTVIVCDQNTNSSCRLLYKLRSEISHGQRVESNAAVVKFPVKT